MSFEIQKKKPLFLHLDDFKLIEEIISDIHIFDKEISVEVPDNETKLLWKIKRIISNIERAQARRRTIGNAINQV